MLMYAAARGVALSLKPGESRDIELLALAYEGLEQVGYVSADGKVITVEATFYDPEAFKRPLHTVTPWEYRTGLDDPEARFTFVECRVQSTIVNGKDGKPTQLIPGDPGFIDYFGRPWAQNWEEHFEKGWKKPE